MGGSPALDASGCTPADPGTTPRCASNLSCAKRPTCRDAPPFGGDEGYPDAGGPDAGGPDAGCSDAARKRTPLSSVYLTSGVGLKWKPHGLSGFVIWMCAGGGWVRAGLRGVV